jgi:hypothetical protein
MMQNQQWTFKSVSICFLPWFCLQFSSPYKALKSCQSWIGQWTNKSNQLYLQKLHPHFHKITRGLGGKRRNLRQASWSKISQTKDRKFSVDLIFPHCIQCYCNLSQWYHHHHGYVIENWVVQSTILESRINGRGVQRQGSCLSHLLIRAASCFSRKEIPRASVGHREGTVDKKGEMEEDTVNAIKHTLTHTQGVNGQLEIVSRKSFASHLHLSRWSLLCESKGMCFLASVHIAFLNLQTTHLLIMTHGNSTWSKLQKVWVLTQEGVQE